MALDEARALIEPSNTPHIFFDALNEDVQMYIVHWALVPSSTISECALALRLVKKLFYQRLTGIHGLVMLCRHVQPLREAIHHPYTLVRRLVQVIIDARRTAKQTLGPWYFPTTLYTRMTDSVWTTLESARGEIYRHMHFAIRVVARQQLLDAHFDDPEDFEWCVVRLCRVLRYMDQHTRFSANGYPKGVSVRDRLTLDTPDLPPSQHHFELALAAPAAVLVGVAPTPAAVGAEGQSTALVVVDEDE